MTDKKNYDVQLNWDSEAKIEILGAEWEALTSCLNIFQPAVMAINAINGRNIAKGIIRATYVNQDGTPVAETEVVAIQAAQIQEYQRMIQTQEEALKKMTAKKEGDS
jgi:hypothetical protein